MCDPSTASPPSSHAVELLDAPVRRRTVLLAGALAVPFAATPFAVAHAGPDVARPRIHPRAEWADNRPPTARAGREDVRFLLVHHTQTPTPDRPAAVPARLRQMYDFHTGEKGWPDLAYNFLVDPFGGIWEGRAGSLAGPVRGDATGGSQGFAQLCCFVGDHTGVPPTPQAMAAMAALLGWLAGRYSIDLTPRRRVAFVSRGSNRWPRGARVATDPIAAHRDMSLTECPGDALYPLVRSRLLPQARAVVAAAGRGQVASGPPTQAAPSAVPSATASRGASGAPTTTASATPSASTPATSRTSVSPTSSSPTSTTQVVAAAGSTDEGVSPGDALPVLGVLGLGGGAVLAAHLVRRDR
ncbi:N-acetylmuramoyl-L-alanine amidase [Agilicoccus flavus]|uniref:N-acetylmuramoyl-L-alanine amidase n=1 Tax=Agilicoccus flavus TaxID=2775968 RepID=UPI001CF6C26C|nr:N-acetylmuramoyl-L-alanine amidase [Agilicoccus flavus]